MCRLVSPEKAINKLLYLNPDIIQAGWGERKKNVLRKNPENHDPISSG